LKGSKKGPKEKGKGLGVIKYEKFIQIVDGERLWQELEEEVEGLKDYFVHQLSVRSSASLDLLPVELEGDMFPLNEIAGAFLGLEHPCHFILQSSPRRIRRG
jgi:hypothetical protein